MTLTKRELIIELSNRTGQTQSHVLDIFQTALDLITEELTKGNRVALRRFGTFEVRVTLPRVGRNPNDPASDIPIPARAGVKFRPGRELRALVAAVALAPANARGRSS